MVKEHQVSKFHLIAHHVPCLVIAHAVPMGLPITYKIGVGIDMWLGFHEPICWHVPSAVVRVIEDSLYHASMES